MRTGRSWSLAALLAVLSLAGSGPAIAADPSPQSSDVGASPAAGAPGTATFATPDDAVRRYLEGVAAGDVAMILEASAIDGMSTGFHFSDSVDRLQAMLLTSSLAPTEYPLFAGMDRAFVSAQILSQARILVYSLLSTEILDGTPIVPADKARADAFVAQVDPSRLAGLTLVDSRYPSAKWEHDPLNVKNEAKQAAIYGADESTERLVLVYLDGKLYEVGFTLMRYGDDWRILQPVRAPLPHSGERRGPAHDGRRLRPRDIGRMSRPTMTDGARKSRHLARAEATRR